MPNAVTYTPQYSPKTDAHLLTVFKLLTLVHTGNLKND